MKFIASIPGRRKAFDIPGTRTELRMALELPETEVPKALRLILLRGQLFRVFITELREDESQQLPGKKTKGGVFKKVGVPLEFWASVCPRDGAIRISGLDGMHIILQLPMIDDRLLVQLLTFREKQFMVYIPEKVSEKHTVIDASQKGKQR